MILTTVYKFWIAARPNFSERELKFCLSVTFVRPSHPVQSFGNFSTPFGILARDVHG